MALKHTPRFTESAQHAVFLGLELAASRGAKQTEPEHLLHGLLRCDNSMGRHLIQSLGVDMELLKRLLDGRLPPAGPPIPNMDDVGYSARSMHVLERAVAAVRRHGHSYVGTEHLVLAVQLVKGDAASVLEECQVGAEAIERVLVRRWRGHV